MKKLFAILLILFCAGCALAKLYPHDNPIEECIEETIEDALDSLGYDVHIDLTPSSPEPEIGESRYLGVLECHWVISDE